MICKKINSEGTENHNVQPAASTFSTKSLGSRTSVFEKGTRHAPLNNAVLLEVATYRDCVPTLTQALALVTAANNDRIVVFGTHAETIVGAAGVSIAKSGVQIVGLGQGRLRPTFTFTTSVAASFDVSAANVQIQNLVFVTGIDNQTAVNNVTAADVQFLNCEWAISNGTVGAALGILTAATADRLLVDGCLFRGPAVNAGTTCAGVFSTNRVLT